MEDEVIKKFLYVNRKAPYGTIYALESLEVVLIGAAFDQDVSLAFIDDGVYQLKKDQKTSVDSGIGMKDFSKTYLALGDYDVNKIYVDKASLDERGLTADDLMELVYEDEDDDYKEKSSISIVNQDELALLMEQQDVVLSF
ncbi:MAG: sulfurtransferase complex subunit TusC [Gammaproteobacteria bacterium]|nr:MAG: sulfurtransferase complex subunit TusC [Gammaproteobacteria bacterium]RKZ44187.1 MAG: sulfurtransferase complex subunit TusC [Gammaproteobacteria bacterium]RKZ76928.1 MAG: sulfurtransferase complex subunit TusC [Gammaproteobacteria bacterium]